MPKRMVIKKDDLPLINPNIGGYFVRFRITSEDKNKFSYWSPVYTVSANSPSPVVGQVVVTGSIINVVWDDTENRGQYDIFVKFDSDDYYYHGTALTHNYPFLNNGTSTVQVAIQIASSIKERNSSITIYESDPVSLV